MLVRRQLIRTSQLARPRTLNTSTRITPPSLPRAAALVSIRPASLNQLESKRSYGTGPPRGGGPPFGGGPPYGGGPGGPGGFGGMRFPGQPQQPQQEEKGQYLNQYSIDLTKLAREGKLDPIIGRDEEIRRTIQILSRRTKSNPVLLGLPGVGKTALARFVDAAGGDRRPGRVREQVQGSAQGH
jgi:ATP-dependent Clp protease ATP-binding subunit ClpB